MFQTNQVAELLGMEPWQVQSYAKQGFIEPARRAHGAGTRRAYDLLGLLKLALLRRFCDDGFDLRTIRPVFPELFELLFPADSGDPAEELGRIQSWFRDKVMITCRRFQLRRFVQRESLAAAIQDLIPSNPGLYVIDLGLITGDLCERIDSLDGGWREERG